MMLDLTISVVLFCSRPCGLGWPIAARLPLARVNS